MKYAAFLRAVNVGGRVVKMDALRAAFESLGHSEVETFIASGNVVFDAASKNPAALERAIEAKLQARFGFEIHAFLRRIDELKAIAELEPFPKKAVDRSSAYLVGFFAAPLEPASKKKVLALRNDIDDFHFGGREIHWLTRMKQSEGTFSYAVFEKTAGCRATFRSITTVRKMTERWAAP